MDNNKVRASVAMAVYNGEKYLKEQVDSILAMLGDLDELVVSYDESSDGTIEILRDYMNRDSRVRVVYDTGRSVESNFNNAVKNCSGEYVFLSDQDDVWIDDKINKSIDFFENNPKTVVLISDGYLTDENLNVTGELFKESRISASPLKNFIKGTYLGCQMAFRSSIKDLIWPVRVTPPLPHDLWLGVLGASYGEVSLLNEPLILHRVHASNYSNTSKMKLTGVIKNRWLFFKELRKRKKENKRKLSEK